MNNKATYTEPVNRIKQRILFDDNLQNVACLCENWAEYQIEIEANLSFEFGIQNDLYYQLFHSYTEGNQ